MYGLREGWSCLFLGSLLSFVHCDEKLTTESATTTAKPLVVCQRPSGFNGDLKEPKTSYSLGEVAEITCTEGYRVPYTKSHSLHLRCGADGSWRNLLDQEQRCKRIGSCPAPHVPHSTVPEQTHGYMPDQYLTMTCSQGYRPPPRGEMIRCRADGDWEMVREPGHEPECVEIPQMVCPLPNQIQNGNYVLTPSVQLNSTSRSEPQIVMYNCNYGYRINNAKFHIRQCVDGQWTLEDPKCVKASFKSCMAPKLLPHGSYVLHPSHQQANDEIPEGYYVTYTCDDGYLLANPEKVDQQSLFCLDGQWTGNFPICIPQILKDCSLPPNISHGSYLTIDQMDFRGRLKYTEGIKVYYYCDNGYKLTDKANASVLTCQDGQWRGLMPTCERRSHCDAPQDIPNGNWVLDIKYFRINYGPGTQVHYECRHGFQAMGSLTIECLSSGYWSDYAPRCLASNQYCEEPSPLEDGVYMCKPSHCDMFKVNTEVHFVCNKDRDLQPPDMRMQTCLAGGIWSGEKPQCVPSLAQPTKPVRTDYMNLNASTLTVVIATSCGVLGLLVVVMVVVALQRRKKPRLTRLCNPSTPPPPPYNPTPPTGLVDDPDRVALIAFADGVQVVLPSYEEAIRSRPGSRMSRYTSDRGSIRSSSSRDYRPLPSLRSTGGPQIREIPPDHHRNSIITCASTATRDNLSLMLGSIDTMNISDGTSTSVTVDTASSNPSIATSQRAAAGSIESSSTNGSLAYTEEAPLLDQNHYNTETMRSHHSNASDTHNNTQRGGGGQGERISGYDTLRSQGSRSQSESSPIVEVPEDQKDA